MDLVCEKAGLGEMSQTLLMLGQGIGCFFFMSLADRFGRKPVYIFTTAGLTVLSIIIASCPEVGSLTFFRFLYGCFQQGVSLSCFTLFLEMMPPRHRMLGSVMCGTVWSTSLLTMGLFAWIFRYHSWRTLQYFVAITTSYCVIMPWCLAESPRWLGVNNKSEEALKILKTWCRWNGKDYGPVKKLFEINVIDRLRTQNSIQEKGQDEDHTETVVERYNILDLFRHKEVFITSLIVCFVWVTNGVTYFGLILTSSSLAGDRYVNFFLSCIAEWPSHTVAYICLKRMRRKLIETIFLVISGACLTTSVLLLLGVGPQYHITSIVFSMIGKFSITAAFNTLYLYTPELYPTNLRSVGLGVASALSRFGGMVAPYSRFLAEIAIYAPGTIFSIMCILSSLLVQLLPETRGKALPTSIEELKQWRKRDKQEKKIIAAGGILPDDLDLDIEMEVGAPNGASKNGSTKRAPKGKEQYRYSLVETWIAATDVDESDVF